jgi:hypothetical protein
MRKYVLMSNHNIQGRKSACGRICGRPAHQECPAARTDCVSLITAFSNLIGQIQELLPEPNLFVLLTEKTSQSIVEPGLAMQAFRNFPAAFNTHDKIYFSTA